MTVKFPCHKKWFSSVSNLTSHMNSITFQKTVRVNEIINLCVSLQVGCPIRGNIEMGYNSDFTTNTIAAHTKHILMMMEVYHHYLRYGN